MSIQISATTNTLRQTLDKFMKRPQRHRLLHGYPLAAAMPYAEESIKTQIAAHTDRVSFRPETGEQLLVGVLPHPFCNPKIRGCGFCTFPHESFSSAKSAAVVGGVINEIDASLARNESLSGAKVSALYFGGGTANLTPPKPFQALAQKIAESFDLSESEVSLEGVPRNFVRGEPRLLDVLQQELPARHFRISMGMQTFSEERIKQMGRIGFGHPSMFASVVSAAHQRGMTASGDLLFNLPHQSLDEMRDDLRQAIDIGLDQICLYHLVLFQGLGTVWSRDASLISSLPSNEIAAENWMILREELMNNGYHQTSLTNFERDQLQSDPRRYRYEPISYSSANCRVLGFGPAGISYTSMDGENHLAVKTMNPESSAEYLQAVEHSNIPWNRYFQYAQQDLELLHFTRRLAALTIRKSEFDRLFGDRAWSRYFEQFELLESEGLVRQGLDEVSLTPRGMFYSDSVTGLLADSHLKTLRSEKLSRQQNDNSYGHM